jgi:hypothetical protein
VGVVAAFDRGVKRESGVVRERHREVVGHRARERADGFLGELAGKRVVGASRHVDDDAGDRLVEGDAPVRVPADATFVAQRLVERFSKTDRDILDRVVVVDVGVAVTPNREIEEAVFRERAEHVVVKADAGVDLGVAVAVDGEREVDRRLGRLPGDGRGSVVVAHTAFSRGTDKAVVADADPGRLRRSAVTAVDQFASSAAACASASVNRPS